MSLTGSTTAQKIWNFLKSKGLNDYGIAGLMGNLKAESNLSPTNLQNSYEKKLGYTDDTYTMSVDNGDYTNFVKDAAGYGLAQWTYWSRKQAILNYAKSQNTSIGDLEMQLNYLYKELSENYKTVLNTLKTAKSVLEASNAVLLNFERPANQSVSIQNKRASYGQTYYDTYATSSQTEKEETIMGIRIGHASISENGTVNGTAGDSTGKEVCIREWYSKPWDYMAIHPDATVREKHAVAVEAACKNDNIGYSQATRNTLNTQAKAVGYDLSKVSKCNCDCSSLQNVAAVASGSGATYGSNGWTTSTMKAKLQALGYKIITASAYLTASKYCVRGAIYVKAGSHTVCGLDNGSNYKDTLVKAGIVTESSSNTSTTSKKTTLQPAKSKDSSLAGTYKTTAGLNLRYGPNSTEYASMVVMPKGTEFRCYGYYTETNGTKWLYGIATVNGKKYTGFCSKSYLTK